jgi:phage gpG-like protein
MGISGDFSELRELQGALNAVASAGFRRSVNAELEETARTLVALEFETSIDPYGHHWADLKSRDGQPLLDTGRLRNSFGGDGADSSAFRFGTDVVYASLHQYGGTVRHAARAAPRTKAGRFLSHGRASRSAAKSQALTFLPEHDATVPQRQMMPEGDLPDSWLAEFNLVVDEQLELLFGGIE